MSRSGYRSLSRLIRKKGIESISFPQLGAGNGGLDWEREVKPLMEKYLGELPITVYIHCYPT
ncbi:macro domain-containing protein [Lactiplantibacillus pentosus]